MDIIPVRCSQCGALMESKQGAMLLQCPYCKSTSLVVENDPVVIERIRQDTYKEVEKMKLDHETEMVKLHAEQESKKKHLVWWVLGWIFFFPAPLTILIVKNEKLDFKKKAIILAVIWGVILIVGIIGNLTDDDSSSKHQSSSSSHYSTVSQQSSLIEARSV